VVKSEAGTLVESDLGTLVINEDSEDDSTMKRKSTVYGYLLINIGVFCI
jgi:hypothetical protein